MLKSHYDVIEVISDEIKREQEAPINGESCEEIALEYKYRQGIKQGLVLFIQRLNSKADLRE
jgi:hypothetical protein